VQRYQQRGSQLKVPKSKKCHSKWKADLAYKQSESIRIVKIREMGIIKMTAEEEAEYRRRATETKRHTFPFCGALC